MSYFPLTANIAQYKNYIGVNPQATTDTTGWATYSNTAANIPSSGTGGTATGLTFSRTVSPTLQGPGSFSIVQTNSTSLQGKGVSFDFVIDAADKARTLQISFDYNASSTFVASNGITPPLNDGTTTTNAGNSDIEVFILDTVNSVLIPVSPQTITANGGNNFQFKGNFQTNSNSNGYRLILHVATANANASGWTFLFDNVIVSPQTSSSGAIITDWVPFTPTGNWTVNTTYSGFYRRVGGDIEVQYTVNLTGAPNASTVLTLNMPTGFTIDTTRLNAISSTNYPQVGQGFGAIGGNGNEMQLAYSTTTAFRAVFLNSISAATTGGVTSIAPGTWGNGDKLTFLTISLPVVGSGATNVMSNDADTRIVSMYTLSQAPTLVSGTLGSTPHVITFSTVAKDTHGAYNTSTGLYTVPVSGFYEVYGNLRIAATLVAGNYAQPRLLKNGSAVQQITFRAGGAQSDLPTPYKFPVFCSAGDSLSIDIGTDATGPSITSGPDNFMSVTRLTGPATIAAADAVNARYFASATSISGSLATINWTTKDYDTHNGMSSGVYTVPVSGKYQVNTALLVTGTVALNNSAVLEVQKNGTVVSRFTEFFPASLTDGKLMLSDCISCVAGDTIRVQVSTSVTIPSIVSSNFDNYFSLVRVGN